MMRPVKTHNRRWKMAVAAFAASAALWPAGARAQMPATAQPTPRVGDKAGDFALQSLDGVTVRLSEELVRGPLVLVVLRGWPGLSMSLLHPPVRRLPVERSEAPRREAFRDRSFTRARATASELTRRRSRPMVPSRLASGSCSIPTIRSLRCTGCAGMRRTKPRIRQHSSSTRMASSPSRRSATITATASQQRNVLKALADKPR